MNRSQSVVALAVVFVLTVHHGLAVAHTDITSAEAREMLESGEEVILLDVRESYEICGSLQHIADAVNLPWLAGDLEARFWELVPGAKIIAVCASGSRSDAAANFLDGEGFTQVYDMLGGMSEWSWDTEPCDPEPKLRILRDAFSVQINWTATAGAQDYDLLRGDAAALARVGDHVDLGSADCLADDSPYTYLNDASLPAPGQVYYYLARQKDGEFGYSSEREPRVAANPACE
jgi:rhodanese-related sulfurtransferase